MTRVAPPAVHRLICTVSEEEEEREERGGGKTKASMQSWQGRGQEKKHAPG